MKVRPFERSTLWRSAFAKRRNDPDERDREALALAYHQLRIRAGDLVTEIHAVLPQLTVHDLTHADTLWDVASEISGPHTKINPLEGFALGAAFLLHDAGMALAAYPNGLADLQNSAEWRDAVVSAWKKRGIDEPTDVQRTSPDNDVRNDALFDVLRARHASQAKILATALWIHPTTGAPMTLVQNDDLLESYGTLIGNIAASHHWPITEVARFFGDPTPASAAWPREWEVDGLLLACILRCADACAIDETRAPSFLFALRKPKGTSGRHWAFQNKIYPAKHRDDGLIFESKSSFRADESADWWLCFDAIGIADQELKTSDSLLRDRRRTPLLVRRVMGADDPDILTNTIKVEGWKPVNTRAKISEPQAIIERLGGKQLYGNEPIVPIRELIQNSVDAIRARRFLDQFFRTAGSDRLHGKVILQISVIPGTEDYWVCIEDNGIGMSENVITGSLLDFGTSFWSSKIATQLYPGLPSEKSFRPIGKFGIGFFSIFMYSNVAIVMSREFRSAKDAWNVLVFEEGVRGRGNFSIKETPDEIIIPDASTRIKMRVNEDFLCELCGADKRALGPTSASIDFFRQTIATKLRHLVFTLDVAIYFSFNGSEPVILNDPLLHEQDLDGLWEILCGLIAENDSVHDLSPHQKKLLQPLTSEGDNRVYGYCGLNISGSYYSCFKSVGGFCTPDDIGVMEALWGIAEYDVTTANREPERLAAPADVINAWTKKQMEIVLREPLNETEREHVVRCLSGWAHDIRPIFFVLTNEGGLILKDFIEKLLNTKVVTFPVESYSSMGMRRNYVRIPRLHDVNLTAKDIEFDEFTVCSRFVHANIELEVPTDKYDNIWNATVNSLRDLKLEVEVQYLKAQTVGKYVGAGSFHHHISTGDPVVSDVFTITLTGAGN
jgi:hypothetical protein